jgi:hypothetical protein
LHKRSTNNTTTGNANNFNHESTPPSGNGGGIVLAGLVCKHDAAMQSCTGVGGQQEQQEHYNRTKNPLPTRARKSDPVEF